MRSRLSEQARLVFCMFSGVFCMFYGVIMCYLYAFCHLWYHMYHMLTYGDSSGCYIFHGSEEEEKSFHFG